MTRPQTLRTRQITLVWLMSAGMAGLAVACLYAAPLPHPHAAPFRLPWLGLAAAWALAIGAVIVFQFRRQGVTVSLSEVPLVVGLVFAAPSALVPARFVASFVVWVVYRRQRSYKAAFNVAAEVLETSLAIRVYYGVLGTSSPVSRLGWLAAFAAIVAAEMLVSHLAVRLVISITTGRPDRDVVRRLALTTLVVTLINCSLGLVTVCVLWVDPLGGILLAAICAIAAVGYRAYHGLRQRQAILERIHDFTQAVDGHHDLEGAVAATLRAARDTMSAENAELCIQYGGGWLRYRMGQDDRLELTTGDSPEALERLVMASGKGVLVPRGTGGDDLGSFELARRGIREAVAVPLRSAELDGALTVTDRLHEALTFVPDDLRALTSMGAHAAIAVHTALLVDRLAREVDEKEFQALHDSLTGLPNRTLFASEVDEMVGERIRGAASGTVAVTLIDLDSFREVNDTLGHGVGDVVLRATASRLRNEIGRRGTVARLGGDEFAVLVSVKDRDEAHRLAEEMITAIEQPIEEDDDLLIEVRASAGVALFPAHGDDAATLLRMADVAMYAAKEHRSGVVLYESRHDHYSHRRLALAGELRQAIANGDLSLAYQPQQDLQTGHITAVEALVRWYHRKHGLVAPDEFIPVAEQTGLIVPLTDFVLTQALSQLQRWSMAGLDLTVAVNLSPRVVQDVHLPALVAERLVQTGTRADRLTLELTESSLVTDPARAAAVLNQLAAMGVRTSIDDFGTGYSSLSRLSDLPVNEVKIDKSFVFAMADGGVETVVRSIVDLGHNLNLRVVAEGVEDEATLARLGQLRCDAAQGHVLSRAISGFALQQWLADQRVRAETGVIVPLRPARGSGA